MAKGKNSKSSGTRDAPQSLPSVRSRSIISPVQGRHLQPLNLIDDRRSYHPEPATRPARLFSGAVASVKATITPKHVSGKSRVPVQIAFTAPDQTLVCVRRKTRKQVLFAKRKTGKAGQRKPKRNMWSNVRCR